MNGFFPRLLLLCLIGLGLIGLPWQAVATEPPNYQGAAGMLVLRNGNVLAGRVMRLKDYYRIEMPKGQLQIPVNQVDLFCHNLDEAYAERRRLRTGSTADSHLELAQWCLRHRLYKHAAQELLDARAIDPGHRQLGILERRLHHIQNTQNISRRRTPAKAAAGPVPTHPREIVKKTRLLPQGPRVMFVRQIQPMLVKSCAATGCHQSGSSLRLNRLAVDGTGHPQATRSNLASTLAQVDWQLPRESSLLSFAKTTHGDRDGISSRPLSPRQTQMLQRWLELLSTSSHASEFAKWYEKPAVDNPPPKVALKGPVFSRTNASSRIRRGVRTANAEFEDPFDPEVFNRRYHQEASPESEPTRPDEQTNPALQKRPAKVLPAPLRPIPPPTTDQ